MTAIHHQTDQLSPADARKLARLAIIIVRHFLEGKEWTCELQGGSFTIQRRDNNRAVVKLLADSAGSLKRKLFGAAIPPGLSSYVIGVELASFDPFVAECIRDRMARDFGEGYADPRGSGQLVNIQPIQDHLYDIAFLPEGPCKYKIPDTDAEGFLLELQRGGRLPFP